MSDESVGRGEGAINDRNVGTVYLADDGEPLAIPRHPAFEILSSGWISVVRNGTTLYYPPGSVDHVEIATREADAVGT